MALPELPVIAGAHGTWLRDTTGRDYLDLNTGYGSVWLGHGHEAVTRALEKQLRTYAAPGFLSSGALERAEAALSGMLPSTHRLGGIYSTGMEAVETAIRAAQAQTGRTAVAGFAGSTHGRSFLVGNIGARNANPLPDLVHRLPSFSAGVDVLAPAIERLVNEVDLAAILLEPIQMTDRGYALPDRAASILFESAQRRGIPVIVDETLTGLYRCGTALYSSRFPAEPDVVVLGKGLANGFPASAVSLRRGFVWDRDRVRPGSTFWNHPLACAAIESTIEALHDTEPESRVAAIEATVWRELAGLTLRGAGALWCLELPSEHGQREFVSRLLHSGVIVSYFPGHIRLLPPITIDADALALGCARIRDAYAATRW